MALRTVSALGGNWNATTAWAGGVVPVVGDTVDFAATSGNLVVNVATANLAGIDFTNYVGTITFNAAISTNGTVNLGTGGYTQAGVSGLVLTNTTTITSNGTVWSRNLTFASANITYTLADTLSTTGTVSLSGTTTTILNGNTLNIGGTLTTTTSATVSGTTNIVFNGSSCTWSNTSTGRLTNNLTINTAGTLTISGTVRYDTGTLTYTAGTVITTGSTLVIVANTTLNTNPIIWNNFSLFSNATVTMSSDVNITGTLTVTNGGTFTSVSGSQLVTSGNFAPAHNVTIPLTSTITLPNVINIVNVSASISGNLNAAVVLTGPGINISGNLTVTANNYSYGLKGTAPLNMIGTGTIDSVNVSGGSIYCPININTTGTITLGTYFNTGSVLTYTQGTFVNNNSSVWIRTGTFDLIGFDNIFWDSNIRTGFDVFTPNYTLSSNLNCRSFNAGGVCTAIGPGVINCNSLSINNNVSGASNITNVFNTDVNVYGTATIGTGGSSFIIGTAAGKAINVYGDLVLSAPVTVYGDATVKMLGTGTITSVANFRQFDLIIDTPGNITISNILYWNTGATAIAGKGITYLRGNVILPKSAGLYLGNLNATFTNMHRIPWPTVTITAGQTITLNEFFSGTANYKTIVQSTSTSPYTISFTDGFEKTTKFVEISNCTLTRPNQLIVVGDCRAKGTNRGIRYTNQSPNGLAKNLAKTKPSMTFDTGGLLPDPNFVKLK